jgi:hypothetical protein
MKMPIVFKKLTLMLVSKQNRLTLRDGYSELVDLGWPTRIITLRMCDRAEEGVMMRYEGIQSWIAYKEEWEWSASAYADSGDAPQQSTEFKPSHLLG